MVAERKNTNWKNEVNNEFLRLHILSENSRPNTVEEMEYNKEMIFGQRADSLWTAPQLKNLSKLTEENYNEDKNPLNYYRKVFVNMMAQNNFRYLTKWRSSFSVTPKQVAFLEKLKKSAQTHIDIKNLGENLNEFSFYLIVNGERVYSHARINLYELKPMNSKTTIGLEFMVTMEQMPELKTLIKK